jgi:hypothetical protein
LCPFDRSLRNVGIFQSKIKICGHGSVSAQAVDIIRCPQLSWRFPTDFLEEVSSWQDACAPAKLLQPTGQNGNGAHLERRNSHVTHTEFFDSRVSALFTDAIRLCVRQPG